MVVMAARAAQLVGQELLKAHQNRHKLDLQVEEKGIDGPSNACRPLFGTIDYPYPT